MSAFSLLFDTAAHRRAALSDELVGAALGHAAKGLPVFLCSSQSYPRVKGGFKTASRGLYQIRA